MNLNRVLIIEDSDEIVEAISLVLQIRWPEVKVDAASSGEEGIKLAGRTTYSLIILDLGLPDISGFKVLESYSPLLVRSNIDSYCKRRGVRYCKGLGSSGLMNYIV